MTAYAAEQWTDFGVATAGAAAALAGLLVVAISINVQRIIEFPGLPHRAAQALILFTLPLITALLLLVPAQPDAALAWELLIIGALAGPYLLVSDLRVPISEHETRMTQAITRISPTIVSCGSLVVAGITLLAHAGGGLYWIVPAVLAAIVFGLINAWVLLIEILR